MIIKRNSAQGRTVFAICDDELLGKIIEEEDKILDLSVDFYKGEKFSVDDTKKIMQAADNLNLVGEKTIALAQELKIISKENTRTIGGVPYAQSSRLDDAI